MERERYIPLLLRAQELADRGRGSVEPNPRVGAIALSNDEPVGEGWHRFYGRKHAEELAIDDAYAKGHVPEELVVTLEPCSSRGRSKKRPPCTRLLIDSGISRVVVGLIDPDPRHQGRGLDQLRHGGIEIVGPFDLPELESGLARFRHWLGMKRPWVIAKWAATLDGKTATRTGSARWISDDPSLVYAHELRTRVDTIVVGMGTVLSDDPELTARLADGDSPRRVIVDPMAELPLDSKLVATIDKAPLAIIATDTSPAERRRALEQRGVEVMIVPGSTGDGRPVPKLAEALANLFAAGSCRVLVEGGGRLLWQFLAADCLDQVEAVIAPKLCGGQDAPTALSGEGVAMMHEAIQLDDVYQRQLGSCVLIGGFVSPTEGSS